MLQFATLHTELNTTESIFTFGKEITWKRQKRFC